MISDSQPTKGTLGMYAAIPRRVRALIYLTTPALLGIGYYIVVITAYLPEIGVDASYVGLILGSFGISTLVAAIPFGILADTRGRKRIVIFALAGIPIPFLIYGLTVNVTVLILASLVSGVIEAAFLTAWNAMIADMTTLETRNVAFSLSFIVSAAATGIGFAIPAAFPVLHDLTGLTTRSLHTGTFLVFAAASVISPIMGLRVLKDYRETRRERQKLIRGESMGIIVRFSSINSLIGLGAGFIIPLIPTWLLLKFGIPDTYSGPLLGVSSGLMAVSAIASAKLANRYGNVNAIVMTQGSSTIFMFALAYSNDAVVAGGLYLIRAALMNMASPVSDSYLMGIISEKERGIASAINGITWRLPNSVSTIAGGVLLDQGKYALPFFIATAFYVVSIVLFYTVFRRIKPKA